MGDEGEWISRGEDREFTEYENRVERFIAALEKTIEELRSGGHLDDAGRSKLLQLAKSF
jgi:hypothetical protein